MNKLSPIDVPLWEGTSPSSMKVVFPETASPGPRPALIVFQGGAYSTNAGSGGGSAEWAAKHGMVGILVKYGTRATRQFYPENYADAARAVRLVRHRAAEWGIDAARVGVMGFSAGSRPSGRRRRVDVAVAPMARRAVGHSLI